MHADIALDMILHYARSINQPDAEFVMTRRGPAMPPLAVDEESHLHNALHVYG